MAGRFQFSIRFLLVATAAVAAGVAAIRAFEPTAASILAINCLTVLFATAAILAVTQTSGKVRTFWIGTAIVLGPAAFFSVEWVWSVWPHLGQASLSELAGWFEDASQVWPFWCFAPINGLAAVFLHCLFAPRPTPPS